MSSTFSHQEYKELAVIGDGAWGTTLAWLQSPAFHRVSLVVLEGTTAEEIVKYHVNSRAFDWLRLPPNIVPETSVGEAVKRAALVIVAVPSSALRPVAREVCEAGCRQTVVIATKGMERGAGLLALEVWREESRRSCPDPLLLSGPNLASEIAGGMPAVSVLAGVSSRRVNGAIEMLQGPALILQPWHDPLGAQCMGALKNAYAIACGMASGLGWGANVTAAIVWRGLEEARRFALALGADPNVSNTPAGVGDFMATCISPLSRNYDAGMGIARAGGEAPGVREGEGAAIEASRRARALGLELPLLESIKDVLVNSAPPKCVMEAATSDRRPQVNAGRGKVRGLATATEGA
jgi:glycerol-3-phosphate dehydrogenase (NAD(P)+)